MFLFGFTVFMITSCGQKDTQTGLSKSVEQKIDSLFADFTQETPGYAIGIAKNDEVIYKKAFGSANLDYGIPITPQSSFSIASVSKQFTAACIALLILEDKLSLETPASNFIPELKKCPDTIRVKHLMYNTSGIPDYTRLQRKGGKSWVSFNYFDIDESIETSLTQDKLQFKPGERWDYSNMNFMLLTKIVESVSGQSFRDFIRVRLFEPLEMNNSFIHDDITQIVKNRVMPYNPRTQLYVDAYREVGFHLKEEGDYIQHHRNSPHYGGSGVVSTIDDLLKWTSNMVTKKFGGQEFYDLMHKTLKFDHDRDNQAFGLYLNQYKGKNFVAWEGGDYGISSQLIRFPDQGIGIIVLSNLGSGDSPGKANQIADILIDEGILE